MPVLIDYFQHQFIPYTTQKMNKALLGAVFEQHCPILNSFFIPDIQEKIAADYES